MPALFNLDQIRSDLASAQPEIRGRAMQVLLAQVKKEPSLRPAALPLFRAAIEVVSDAWTASYAALGIEFLAGPVASQAAWLKLLRHADAQVVVTAAFSISDPFFAPVLLESLHQRTEPRIHKAAIRALGRMKYPAAFALIVERLEPRTTRAVAIQALQDMEDPRALPYLEPLLQDETVHDQLDERGATLRICDLANYAVLRLRHLDAQRTGAAPVTSTPTAGVGSGRAARNLLAYTPLAAALAEIPWVAGLVFVHVLKHGTTAHTEAQIHRLDLLALLPPAIGLVTGGMAVKDLLFYRRGEKILLALGGVACAAIVVSFSWELFH